jgi:hypothetical protein
VVQRKQSMAHTVRSTTTGQFAAAQSSRGRQREILTAQALRIPYLLTVEVGQADLQNWPATHPVSRYRMPGADMLLARRTGAELLVFGE